jgi:hypothetical protein
MTFQQSSGEFQDQHSESQSAISQFAEDIAGSLFSPSERLREIGERAAVIPALLLVMLIVLIQMAGQAMVLMLQILQLPGFQTPGSQIFAATAAFQLTSMLWNLLWVPVLWTVLAGILYGVTRLMGGVGQFGSLWAASGFALAPQLLVAPFLSAGELLALVGAGAQFVGWLVVVPIFVAGFFWSLILYVIAIRETMSVSTGRAVGALAILFAVVVGIAVLLFCMFLLFIVGIIGVLSAAG